MAVPAKKLFGVIKICWVGEAQKFRHYELMG